MPYSVILLLCLVGVAFSVQPCELPFQFQAHMTEIINLGTSTLAETGEIYYDYTNKRVRADVETGFFVNDNTTYTFSSYQFFDKKEEYFFDRNTGECQKQDLQGTLPKPVIPPTSHFFGSALIGSQVVHNWYIPDAAHTSIEGVLQVTEGTCFPISQLVFNKTSNEFVLTQNFFNLVPEVPLYIPHACRNATTTFGRKRKMTNTPTFFF